MNPENVGQHITMHHTKLWRKPLFQEPQVPDRQTCHKQLNELGTTGLGWRSRNNFIHTNFSQNLSHNSSWRKTHRSVVLDKVLTIDKRESQASKTMKKSLIEDLDKLEKSNQLVEGMKKLKQMNLLTGKSLQKTTFPGIIKHQHIYNDYHTKETNQGFSRNFMGKFYTK